MLNPSQIQVLSSRNVVNLRAHSELTRLKIVTMTTNICSRTQIGIEIKFKISRKIPGMDRCGKQNFYFYFYFSRLGQKSADFGLIQHRSTGSMFGLVQGRTDGLAARCRAKAQCCPLTNLKYF